MKTILINHNTQNEEVRVAILKGDSLYDLIIESAHQTQLAGNIYKGVITRIEPSLEAAFVDYGGERHGFLPLKEVSPSVYQTTPENENDVRIDQVLSQGQEIMVQVEKDQRGNKGASLTTNISLASLFLILMPLRSNFRTNGISRSLTPPQRDDIRDKLANLSIPSDMRLIVRTSGADQSQAQLQWHLDYLLKLWGNIQEAANNNAAPVLLYQESDLMLRTIRDYLREDVEQLLIDDEALYEKARDVMQVMMPEAADKVRLYDSPDNLFSAYQVEAHIENALEREVGLPSGGMLVFDRTEALIAIDVNSGKATQGKDIEETAFKTNQEAAHEIAKQLRLRNAGGLIVIDFIDMQSASHRKAIENLMQQYTEEDRARVKIGRISRFGLLELSRQRLRNALTEYTQNICPHCNGTGIIRSIRSLANGCLRSVEETATSKNAMEVQLQVPPSVATYLMNEGREEILRIEKRHALAVIIIANEDLRVPDYDIEAVPLTARNSRANKESHELKTARKPEVYTPRQRPAVENASAKVADVMPDRPKPQKGLWQRFKDLFDSADAAPKSRTRSGRKPRDGERNKRGERGYDRNGNGRRYNSHNNNGNRNRRHDGRGDRNDNSSGERENRGRSSATDNRADSRHERGNQRRENRHDGRNENRNDREPRNNHRNDARDTRQEQDRGGDSAGTRRQEPRDFRPSRNNSGN